MRYVRNKYEVWSHNYEEKSGYYVVWECKYEIIMMYICGIDVIFMRYKKFRYLRVQMSLFAFPISHHLCFPSFTFPIIYISHHLHFPSFTFPEVRHLHFIHPMLKAICYMLCSVFIVAISFTLTVIYVSHHLLQFPSFTLFTFLSFTFPIVYISCPLCFPLFTFPSFPEVCHSHFPC